MQLLAKALPAVAAVLLVPAAARADDAAAQALFSEARGLMAQGHYAEACPKLEESQREAPAIGTLFNLADCYEHTDRLASAWAAFLKVAAETKVKGQTDREQAARSRAHALEPRLGKLVLEVPRGSAVSGLEVRRDGESVGAPSWGVAAPVDAGDHAVEARAPGKNPWNGAVHVADGEVTHVGIPALTDAPTPPAAPAPSGGEDHAAPRDDRPARDDTGGGAAPGAGQRTLGYVVLASSAVFLGAGVIGAIQHESAVTDYNNDPTCPPPDSPNLPSSCADRQSSANTWKTVEVVGFVGAGALLVTGAVLLLSAPSGPPARASECGPGPGLAGLACSLRF
jgi:hypothetical protein